MALNATIWNLKNDTEYLNYALDLFKIQAQENKIYKEYIHHLKVDIEKIKTFVDIPFLPISFFKTQTIKTGNFTPEVIFESSGTSDKQQHSKNHIQSLKDYQEHSLKNFEYFFSTCKQFNILALLPNYIEKGNSSLVAMVQNLMQHSMHKKEYFYLYEHKQLSQKLHELETQKTKNILFGVTYALIDFAKKYPMPLKNTIIIETGGMKGREEEMTRNEVHKILKQAFQLETIYSEYGMTELFSQAYSKEKGIFKTPPWLKVFVREIDDPQKIHNYGSGALNIIDLGNKDSIAFIATEDYGKVYKNGSFEILGRIENSDIRGCNLLYN